MSETLTPVVAEESKRVSCLNLLLDYIAALRQLLSSAPSPCDHRFVRLRAQVEPLLAGGLDLSDLFTADLSRFGRFTEVHYRAVGLFVELVSLVKEFRASYPRFSLRHWPSFNRTLEQLDAIEARFYGRS